VVSLDTAIMVFTVYYVLEYRNVMLLGA
jgi:hypothetical protein